MTIGRNRVPYSVFLKLFVTWCGRQRLLRMGRLVYSRHGGPGNGVGYSAKLSMALRPVLFHWKRERDEWFLTFLGVRVHYAKHYGGWVA